MKIVKLVAENVKKIKAIEIRPDGALIQITGANGSGKSSVLDSIWWALGGTKHIDAKPVRDGMEKAVVRLDLGEIVVTRTFTAESGSTTLKVEGDGTTYKSPQNTIDKLLGSLTFDPLAFSRMEPKAQLDELRRLVKLDVDIDQLDLMNRRDFSDRTDLNRHVKDLKAQIAGLDLPAERTETVTVNAIMAAMERAQEANTARGRLANERSARDMRETELREDLDRVNAQIEALQTQRDQIHATLKYNADVRESEPPLPDLIDLGTFRTQMAEAQAQNEVAGRWLLRDQLTEQLEKEEADANALTARMEERTRTRAEAIAAAQMPVAGLGFGDGMVTLHGFPFAQASSAEQLRVSVAIAMAANPTLRILRIKDGSLLDENSLALIASMAESHDYQIFLEVVDTSGKVGVYLEDGAVVAIDGKAVASPAVPA